MLAHMYNCLGGRACTCLYLHFADVRLAIQIIKYGVGESSEIMCVSPAGVSVFTNPFKEMEEEEKNAEEAKRKALAAAEDPLDADAKVSGGGQMVSRVSSSQQNRPP